MGALKADRRLYETAAKDALVEEGDTRGRYLVAGVGSTIGASDVAKYKLKDRRGRVWYPGCAAFPDLTVPELKELGRYEEDKAVEAAETKGGFTLNTLEDQEREKSAEAAAADQEADQEAAGADDHSDRNEVDEESGAEAEEGSSEAEALPEWPLASTPAAYIAKYGDAAPNSELAQRHVDAGGSGGT